jgi:DNA invertase Pin-like site-specific DNA recombinase
MQSRGAEGTSIEMSAERNGVTETNDSVTAIGYVRVSTADQAGSGAGLLAQRAAIEAACCQRGWQLSDVIQDAGQSGRTLSRPGLQHALEALAACRAQVFVVAKLDRLSRSLMDFAGLMERSRSEGWALVALDLGVDTSTPQGEMMAAVMASFAQYERRLIGQRTKEALDARRSQGVKLGRPTVVSRELRMRIQQLRDSGMSFRAIAAELESQGVAAPRGGTRWHGNSVRRLLPS